MLILIDKINLLDFPKVYSYADYLTWNFDERVELIKGELFQMSPAPRRLHQRVAMELSTCLNHFFKNRKCSVYAAPFDVRLFPSISDEDTFTVVQPDICVICNLDKLDDRGCKGAPDLIVEILSPATMKKDLQDKFELYQESVVKEYWIAHPEEKIIKVFYLENGRYQISKKYTVVDKLISVIFPDLEIDLEDVFVEN